MTRLTLLAVLTLAVWLSVPSAPEAAEDGREPGYLRAPMVWPQATPTSTPEERVMEISAYVCEDIFCRTALGVRAEVGIVAATSLAMGQRITIDGLPGEYVVADRGPLRSDQIDVFMVSRSEALAWGRQKRTVTIEKGATE